MKQLPDEQTLKELLSMGKGLEEQARKVYQMSEALAQKYGRQSVEKPQSPPQGTTI
ncbi:MAG: hypothetical protein AAF298_02340 [Cyanobacteria bacterium P01_A01_bin.40]